MSRPRPWWAYPDYCRARASWLRKAEASPTSAAAPPPPPLRLDGAGDTGVDLLDLGPAQCRFALTDEPPHRFCGAPTAHAGEAYCEEHARLCRVGRSDWRELERMIHGAEVTLALSPNDVKRTLGINEVLRAEAFARHGE
jgi:hypothetical protein